MATREIRREDLKTLKFAELKEFLKIRGISRQGATKAVLLQLAENAINLNVPNLAVEPDDFESERRKRRTVKISGREVELVDIRAVRNWGENLKFLPDVDLIRISSYLRSVCRWSDERLVNYRKDNGHKLFVDGHVYGVKIHFISGTEFIYVKCCCVRETSQTAKPYETWILMASDGRLLTGGCDCVADDGSCKHCVALLFSLSSFTDRHKDRHTEAGTDRVCTWDKPRRESAPMVIDDIDIRTNRTVPLPPEPLIDTYNPAISNPLLTPDEIRSYMYNACAGTNSLLLQTLDTMSDDDDSSEKPKTMFEFVSGFKTSSEPDFFQYLKDNVDGTHISTVNELTVGQRETQHWFDYRQGRLTASLFYDCCHYQGNHKNNYLVSRILSKGSNSIFSEAIKFGIENEPVAKHLYYEYLCGKGHKGSKIRNSGFVISSDIPFLGASPDGIVECSCCGKLVWLLEIKCCYKHKDKFPSAAAQDKSYHVYLEGDRVRLKKTSKWYFQIQGQLGVTNLPFCDFVLFTNKGISVDRIHFDEDMWKSMKARLTSFYHTFIILKVLER
ncbi:uncharacterized protein [Ptychodera flava]|uniref:uncharacterized protein n=1 Tax=Ptychodera flava TaxID=63121 RepID=UPI00396A29A2